MCRVMVEFKGFLGRYAGPGGKVALDLPRETSVRDALEQTGIPEASTGLILLNGRRGRLDACLADGDVIVVYPVVAGG